MSLEAGSSPEPEGRQAAGLTPRFWPCEAWRRGSSQIHKASGAHDCDMRDSWGWRPLVCAVRLRGRQVSCLLLQSLSSFKDVPDSVPSALHE